jgi:hypothetical protein
MAKRDEQPRTAGEVQTKEGTIRFLLDSDGTPMVQIEDELGEAEFRCLTIEQMGLVSTFAARLYRMAVMRTPTIPVNDRSGGEREQ